VLLLHRRLRAADVTAGISAALLAGAVSADVVAVEARKASDASRGERVRPALPAPAGPEVASLTRRRLAVLPADTRPPPSVDRYDQLLHRRARPPAPPPPHEGEVS
jgi:hypothetical protein